MLVLHSEDAVNQTMVAYVQLSRAGALGLELEVFVHVMVVCTKTCLSMP